MDAKEYLMQIQKLDKLIENKLAEVEKWKLIAIGSTAFPDNERVQTSGTKQKMADAVAIYVDIQKEINSDIDSLADLKKEIIKTIEALQPYEYDVLHKIYVQQMSVKEVSAVLDMSYSWVTWIHREGIKHLQKILNERE